MSYDFCMRHPFHILHPLFLKPIRACLGCKGDRICKFIKRNNVSFKLFHCCLIHSSSCYSWKAGKSSLPLSAIGNCGMMKFFVQGISGGLCWKEAWIKVQGFLLNPYKMRSHLESLLMGWDWLQRWVTFDQDRFGTLKQLLL